jgi:hypothetical protein
VVFVCSVSFASYNRSPGSFGTASSQVHKGRVSQVASELAPEVIGLFYIPATGASGRVLPHCSRLFVSSLLLPLSSVPCLGLASVVFTTAGSGVFMSSRRSGSQPIKWFASSGSLLSSLLQVSGLFPRSSISLRLTSNSRPTMRCSGPSACAKVAPTQPSADRRRWAEKKGCS